MWFKNFSLFQFIEKPILENGILETALSDHAFTPCSTNSPISMGWVAPCSSSDLLVHHANGFMMVAFQTQEKIVPASVIKEMLDEKIDEIELREARKIRKKEKDSFKEEIYQILLPRAFTKTNVVHAYLDILEGWLVINTATSKKADLLTTNLRKALGSLKIRMPETLPISMLLTEWLKTGNYPAELTIEDQCVLQNQSENSGTIRCQRQNLFTDDILALIESGREVAQISLGWEDKLSFVITDELMIKSIKFLELIQDQISDVAAETKAAQFDADFVIMTETFRALIAFLMQTFAKQDNLEQLKNKENSKDIAKI